VLKITKETVYVLSFFFFRIDRLYVNSAEILRNPTHIWQIFGPFHLT